MSSTPALGQHILDRPAVQWWLKHRDKTVPSAWRTAEVSAALAAVDPSWCAANRSLPTQTFRACRYFKPAETKCVILGTAPYTSPGRANGLAFGNNPDWVSKHLYSPHAAFGNLVDEVYRSTGLILRDWTLSSWATQGVLLLNLDPFSSVAQALLKQVATDAPAATWLLWGRAAAEAAVRAGVDIDSDEVHLASSPNRWSADRRLEVPGFAAVPAFNGCGHFAHVAGVKWGVARA